MQQSAHKTYSARTDTHYDPERGVLTAILELPGVEKKDMKLSLLTLRHNRVRQLKVWGTLTPTLPLPSAEGMKQYPGAYLRERKFGEFSRTFTVPSDLKREDVQAVMKRGILILKIHLGPPAEAQDVQEITVS
ncbi:hypothetical protein P691DRAFT_679320 [Macrolepiota fuliginosa MF-IS2]|uniref:SHSP domain-containing protein n=1 Tax=Macrolepiota fuliginosa MF-IS2 TaxID=1400762 RepID=A0A9P5X546_9AGAR|nr:hypothetical protein P691DRAFT_679320 [Macrolepiota fuliginosa MF-IS2]